MCAKKTCWYSFITPLRIGLIVGWRSTNELALRDALLRISRFGAVLGIAFQVQDDLLNLKGAMESYGKEIGGDIYEGKRTLMLNHVLSHSRKSRSLLKILAVARARKKAEHIALIMEEMQCCGSVEHGWKVARAHATEAASILHGLDFFAPQTPLRPDESWACEFADGRFLRELVNYVIYRNL